MKDIQPPDELERRREELQREIDEQTANIRQIYRHVGLEQSLRQSFEMLEQFDGDPVAVELVSSEQREILETFGHPTEGYTLLRSLSVEHERRMMAKIRHAGAEDRIQAVRQEWIQQKGNYAYKKDFAEIIADRYGVDFKTVNDRWLKGL